MTPDGGFDHANGLGSVVSENVNPGMLFCSSSSHNSSSSSSNSRGGARGLSPRSETSRSSSSDDSSSSSDSSRRGGARGLPPLKRALGGEVPHNVGTVSYGGVRHAQGAEGPSAYLDGHGDVGGLPPSSPNPVTIVQAVAACTTTGIGGRSPPTLSAVGLTCTSEPMRQFQPRSPLCQTVTPQYVGVTAQCLNDLVGCHRHVPSDHVLPGLAQDKENDGMPQQQQPTMLERKSGFSAVCLSQNLSRMAMWSDDLMLEPNVTPPSETGGLIPLDHNCPAAGLDTEAEQAQVMDSLSAEAPATKAVGEDDMLSLCDFVCENLHGCCDDDALSVSAIEALVPTATTFEQLCLLRRTQLEPMMVWCDYLLLRAPCSMHQCTPCTQSIDSVDEAAAYCAFKRHR